MYVIVGLGNPDKKYEHTRHNIGFDVIDALADKYNISVTDKKHKALCGSGVIEGMKVLLVKPQTYMNLSGESASAVSRSVLEKSRRAGILLTMCSGVSVLRTGQRWRKLSVMRWMQQFL